MQKYYLAFKNPSLEERIVGPPHILDGPASEPIERNFIYDLPDRSRRLFDIYYLINIFITKHTL